MFSTVTSAFFRSSRTISRPRGAFKLRVRDFLLALNWWKYQGSLSGAPGPARRRPGSPVVGFSTLTTSAPSQASVSVQDGPASNCVKSTTLMPSRQSSSTGIVAIAFSSAKDVAESLARQSRNRYGIGWVAPPDWMSVLVGQVLVFKLALRHREMVRLVPRAAGEQADEAE